MHCANVRCMCFPTAATTWPLSTCSPTSRPKRRWRRPAPRCSSWGSIASPRHRTRTPEIDMIKIRTTISNKLGLHARASAKLTKLAGSFPCEVFMSRGDRRINAKSIMGVMMLAAGMGTEVEIETNGDREQEAMDALLALIADKFGEGE